jgi:hypothetical protein
VKTDKLTKTNSYIIDLYSLDRNIYKYSNERAQIRHVWFENSTAKILNQAYLGKDNGFLIICHDWQTEGVKV